MSLAAQFMPEAIRQQFNAKSYAVQAQVGLDFFCLCLKFNPAYRTTRTLRKPTCLKEMIFNTTIETLSILKITQLPGLSGKLSSQRVFARKVRVVLR
jgi:hypothetical protein